MLIKLKRYAWLFWLALPLMLWWALGEVSLSKLWETLSDLRLWQVIVLLVFNLGIVSLFSLRGWIILRSLGYQLPYLRVARYRLASFAVSYFTPGPQFGGESLYVYWLRSHHQVPGSSALAAVSMDKIIELLANFSFLVIGLGVVLWARLLPGLHLQSVMPITLALVVLPAGYLAVLWGGRKPLARLARWSALLRSPGGKATRIFGFIQAAEGQMVDFCRQKPLAFGLTVLLAFVVWGVSIGEYWLSARFLGLELSAAQVIAALTAARLAFLLPMPGGLGALEVGQALAFQAMGFDPVFGLSISLLIRARDITFGLTGLFLGALAARQQAIQAIPGESIRII